MRSMAYEAGMSFQILPAKSVRESTNAVNTTKGLASSQYQSYENVITKIAQGDLTGLNPHISKGGLMSVDIPGIGKGRGLGRVLYTEKDGIIDIIEVSCLIGVQNM